MDGKSSLVGLLGIGLVGAHYKSNPADRKVLIGSVWDTDASKPDPKAAHTELLKLGGVLAFVLVAALASASSDTAGAFFVGLFVLLWVVWGMQSTTAGQKVVSKLPVPQSTTMRRN